MASNPYRTPLRPEPTSSEDGGSLAAQLVIVAVILTWLALSEGLPTGKEFILWAFMAALVVLVTLMGRRSR
jgi:hypothetical protein